MVVGDVVRELVKPCQTTTRPGHVIGLNVSVTSGNASASAQDRHSSMNSVTTWTALSHESLIGPPSEPINIDDFLRGACENSAPPSAILQQTAQHDAIISECRWVAHISHSIVP
jgi:hypothetical protein